MSDGSGRPGNGNGDPLLVRRFVLRPDEVDDAAEPAHTWPPPPRHAPAHQAERSGAAPAHHAERSGAAPAHQAERSGAAPVHHAERSSAAPAHHAERSGAAPAHHAERSGAAPAHHAERSGAAPAHQAERSGAAPVHRAERTGAGTADDAEPTAIGAGTHEPRHAGSQALEPTSIERGTTGSTGSTGSTGIVLPGTIAGDETTDGGPSRRRVLLIAGLVVLVAIALAAAGIGVINGGHQGPQALPTASTPGAPIGSAPGTPGTAPGETTPGTNSAVPAGPPQPGESGQPGEPGPGPGQPGEQRPGQAAAQGSGQAAPGSGALTGPAGQGGPASAAAGISSTMLATAAESSPPAESRTGAIRTDDNRCLALPGGKPRGHNKYALVAPCDGTDGQTWTLDADGTIRLGGNCALAEDTAIRITGCGHRREAQWRAGPGGILLNITIGLCLTDRAEAVIALCTGAADQRWTLP